MAAKLAALRERIKLKENAENKKVQANIAASVAQQKLDDEREKEERQALIAEKLKRQAAKRAAEEAAAAEAAAKQARVGGGAAVPLCRCGLEAKSRQCLKEGPNNKRIFFCCQKGREEQCNFFAWAPPDYMPTPDGGNTVAAVRAEVLCRCGVPAQVHTVKKEGPTCGRQFYKCAKEEQQCKFFEWVGAASSNSGAPADSSDNGAAKPQAPTSLPVPEEPETPIGPMIDSSTGTKHLPPLSPSQRLVVDMVLKQKKSIFFTGSAGTGKSRTLKEIMQQADKEVTKITALTGLAASALPSATTLHSFAGIGLGKGSIEEVSQFVARSRRKVHIWEETQLLIIDEASMMSQQLFEMLEAVARYIRGDERPFGGIQLCLCGDFFQLPPVSKGSTGDDSRYCFESPLWDTCVQHSIELTTVFRQQDSSLVQLLAEVRFNSASKATLELLASLNRPLEHAAYIEPTQLYATNYAADKVNSERLAALPGELVELAAIDSPPSATEQLNNLSTLLPVLGLKRFAQVMLLRNQGGDLVNGSRGVVDRFQKDGFPVVKWVNGYRQPVGRDKSSNETSGKEITRQQVPLRLSWAMTIHKAQGMSIDLLEVDLASVFEKGQAYVALSRARSLKGLRVKSFDPSRFWTDQRVVEFYKEKIRSVDELRQQQPPPQPQPQPAAA
eukprot:gnl/TRDRNA2_/TRDRNA2_85524_c0_seq1.p1 gnl/TRDRNA2_/TRDRNA2_85524_c0~~gnl/TRDRNA2_/TRDRNA2_85524_c0_seq1.p1  ORF type:complete len:685 (-),score=162.88 gnl/TRDRNA2_/TRDRNA2_85524_c0_seq1:78-2087(-)